MTRVQYKITCRMRKQENVTDYLFKRQLAKFYLETVSTVSPSISHEVMGPDAMILVF